MSAQIAWRSAGSEEAVNLAFSGSANGGSDYSAGASSLVIVAGSTSASTDITIVDDSEGEQNETITVNISSVSGGKAVENGNQHQTITIIDNDIRMVTLAANTATVDEANGSITLTAQLNAVADEDVTVTLHYYGLALRGTDYLADADSIVIAAG